VYALCCDTLNWRCSVAQWWSWWYISSYLQGHAIKIWWSGIWQYDQQSTAWSAMSTLLLFIIFYRWIRSFHYPKKGTNVIKSVWLEVYGIGNQVSWTILFLIRLSMVWITHWDTNCYTTTRAHIRLKSKMSWVWYNYQC